MNLRSSLGILRLLAVLEGISYISFALTMPLKYMYDIKGPNFIVGILHGGLFIAYCLFVAINHFQKKWPIAQTLILFLASLVPFMTFWVDKKYLSKEV
jgi:integral membrane protein